MKTNQHSDNYFMSRTEPFYGKDKIIEQALRVVLIALAVATRMRNLDVPRNVV